MKIINDLFESMEARRRRQNRQATIVFGGGCLIFFILGIIFLIVSTVLNAIETANVNSIFGETYARTCQTVPGGNDSPDNIPDAASPRQVLLLIADTQRRHQWHDALPPQWSAQVEEDVAIIGCVEEERIELEICEYARSSSRSENAYTARISREQYQVTLTLINAQNARRIDSQTILGSEPEPCPEDDGEFGSGEQRGTVPQLADFANWLEGYVF